MNILYISNAQLTLFYAVTNTFVVCSSHEIVRPLGGDAVKRCHVKGEMNWNNACLQIAASCDTESTCFLTDPLQIKSESTGIDKHSLFFSVVKNMSDTRDYQRLL